MADHPDAEILRRGHTAFNARDFDTLKECFTEDIRWHNAGRGPLAGTIEGRDSLMRDFFEAQKDAPFQLEDHDVLANDEHVVGLGTLHIDLGGGQTWSFRFTEVCHTREGKISERWAFVEDQQGLDELLAQMMGG